MLPVALSPIEQLHGAFATPVSHTPNDSWPFDQPRNCAVLTMRQVLEEREPILLVSHDDDNHGWQFIGSSDANVDDARVVALEEIVTLDPTVLAVADLLPGWQAVRNSIAEGWTRRQHSANSDSSGD